LIRLLFSFRSLSPVISDGASWSGALRRWFLRRKAKRRLAPSEITAPGLPEPLVAGFLKRVCVDRAQSILHARP
jgi:hypothetical protein